MACCIIAAYLLALLAERVRRIAMFWGIVRPRAGEQADTVYARVGAHVRGRRKAGQRIDAARSRIAG